MKKSPVSIKFHLFEIIEDRDDDDDDGDRPFKISFGSSLYSSLLTALA